MKKQIAIIALIAALAAGGALCPPAEAAGTAVWTSHNTGRFIVHRCTIVSDASGNVSSGAGVEGTTVTGFIVGVNYRSVSGSVPSDLYDLQMLTAAGENILYDDAAGVNVGADIPSALGATGARRTPYDKDGNFKKYYNEIITPAASNMGNSKSSVVELIVW
jgi:hypothetical protein